MICRISRKWSDFMEYDDLIFNVSICLRKTKSLIIIGMGLSQRTRHNSSPLINWWEITWMEISFHQTELSLTLVDLWYTWWYIIVALIICLGCKRQPIPKPKSEIGQLRTSHDIYTRFTLCGILVPVYRPVSFRVISLSRVHTHDSITQVPMKKP